MADKKQVIFIMCDTVCKNMVSCYENPVCKTENLEALASDAAVFENAYTCSPVCGPARSAIFTGLYPSSNGMYSNGMQLGANVKTAGEYISRAGIHSAYVGKWHLDGGDYFGKGECPEGYDADYWYDMRNFLDEMETPEQRSASRKNMAAHFFKDNIREEDTYAHRCVERAIRFVENFSNEDFYLTLSLDEPHDPSQCPVEWQKKRHQSGYGLKKKPNTNASVEDKPDIQQMWQEKYQWIPYQGIFFGYNRGMLACNMFADYEIGRLLKVIREKLDNPLIIYTADHGDMVKSHGLLSKGACMYQETNNIPLIINGTGFKNRRVNTPVSHIDLLPTILDYFNIEAPPHLEGESLYKLTDDNTRRDVFAEFFRFEVEQDGCLGFQPIRNVFDGRFKLNINLNSSDELYDLENDPYELKNLISDDSYAKIRDELHDKILERMNKTRDPLRGYVWKCRPWRKDKRPSYDDDGFERQLNDGESVRLTYSTGNPTTEFVRNKGLK